MVADTDPGVPMKRQAEMLRLLHKGKIAPLAE